MLIGASSVWFPTLARLRRVPNRPEEHWSGFEAMAMDPEGGQIITKESADADSRTCDLHYRSFSIPPHKGDLIQCIPSSPFSAIRHLATRARGRRMKLSSRHFEQVEASRQSRKDIDDQPGIFVVMARPHGRHTEIGSGPFHQTS